MTPPTRTTRLSFVLLSTVSLTLAQGLDPSTPAKEYLRFGGQIVAIENAPAAPAPTISLSSPSLSFGNQTVQTASASQTVTLTNSGTAPLTIASMAITGSNSGDFSKTTTCGSSVAAGGSCTATVTFTPAAAGSRSGSLTITDNAAGSPHTVALNGTGVDATGGATATYAGSDATTQGTWTGKYGADGQLIANGLSNVPAYASVNITGAATYTWGGATDTRALQVASGSTTRIASVYYSSTAFTVDVNLTDGSAHKISLYLCDWDSYGRAETISIADAASGATLDSETFSSFVNGAYASWVIKGHVRIQVTRTASVNGVVNGIFFDSGSGGAAPAVTFSPTSLTFGNQTVPTASASQSVTLTNSGTAPLTIGSMAITGSNSGDFSKTTTCGSSVAAAGNCTVIVTFTPQAAGSRAASLTITDNAAGSPHTVALSGTGVAATGGATASYAGSDTATQGTWTGKYGADGQLIANGPSNVPAYASTSITGAATYTWSGSTDARALQVASGSATRIASVYYSSTAFTIDVNLTDGSAHKISLYLCDWDAYGRAETISIVDAASGATLDSETFFSFANGTYASWVIKGHVRMQVTRTASVNGVVNGIFFDSGGTAPAVTLSASSLAFGNQTIGAASASQTVTLSNTGNAALTISSVAITGSNSGDFSRTTTCGSGLGSGVPAGGSCTATVTFTPAAAGSRSGSLTITDNAAGSPHTVALSGTGVAATGGATATYAGADTVTHGNWTGKYGADGQLIANDLTNAPAYASVTFNGASLYTWTTSTSDVRALQASSGSTSRISSTYYSNASFTIDMNLTDGNAHKISLYLCDWDTAGRADAISIVDAASGAVLDNRTFSPLVNGVFQTWSVKGHVQFQVSYAAGINAVVNGIFFDTGGLGM